MQLGNKEQLVIKVIVATRGLQVNKEQQGQPDNKGQPDNRGQQDIKVLRGIRE